MVILITGASHTGKTLLARRLIDRYRFSCLSIDHLKMGLIRSGQTGLTPDDDDALTEYLWPIVREMIKTAIENGQDLIIEGCYIPFDWQKDFSEDFLRHIRFLCLVMHPAYIRTHFADIKRHANAIEHRTDDSWCTLESVMADNARYLAGCQAAGSRYFLIEQTYPDADTLAGMLEGRTS